MTRPAHHVDVATSAQPAAIAQPPGGIQTAGFPAHSKFASAWANWLFNRLGDWGRELDQSALRAQDCLSIATPQLLKNSGGGFALPIGGGLANLAPDDGGAYVLFGRRVDLSRAALAEKYPTGWTLPSNTTVYAHAREETNFGGSSTGEILISTNTSEVGYQLIWAGTTDAVNLASQNTLASTSAQWVLPIDLAGPLELSGPLTINDDEDETALTVSAAAATAPAARIACSAGGTLLALDMSNAAAIGVDAPVGSGAGIGFRAALTGSAAGSRGLEVTCNSGTAGQGVRVAHAGSGIAGVFIASGSGSALFVNAGSTAATGSTFTGGASTCVDVVAGANASALVVTGSGSGTAVDVTGGSSAGATTLRATGNNNTGKAIVAALPNTATSAARGFYATVTGAAIAAEFVATGSGNALSLTGNTTSAPLRVTGATWPSDTFAGQLAFHATSALWGVSDPSDLAYRGVHASIGGYCYGLATGGTNGDNVGSWVQAQAVTLADGDAPRVAGRRVNVKIKFTVRSQGGTAITASYRLRDTTAGTTLYTRDGTGTLPTAGVRLSAATQDWQTCVVMDHSYTLPTAGTRTFVLEVRRSGGADGIIVKDASIEVTGEF